MASDDYIAQVRQYTKMPKYNLQRMFKEPESSDYKVAVKYDSLLEIFDDSAIRKISCRNTDELSLQSSAAGKPRQYLEDFGGYEARNELLWHRLASNLLSVPEENCKEFFEQKYHDKFSGPKLQSTLQF